MPRETADSIGVFAALSIAAQANDFDRLVVSDQPRLQGARRLARAACKIQIVRQSPERCLFHQHIRIAEGTRIVYLRGFWQDYSIVREVETELRRELSLVKPLRGGNLEVAKRIAAARNPASLHLRRGDYGPFFGEHMMLPIAHYQHPISHKLNQDRLSTFFVFSDDAALAKDRLRGDPRFDVVDHNNETAAHEDLRLMWLCRPQACMATISAWRPETSTTSPARRPISALPTGEVQLTRPAGGSASSSPTS